jgi:transcriptional regulator with XRE-family HTH domain
MIDSAQIRAARGLLNLSQAELASAAAVHVATIRRLEAAPGIRGAAETLWKLQTALERAGVVFIPADPTGGPGVRLSGAPSTKPRRRQSRQKIQSD